MPVNVMPIGRHGVMEKHLWEVLFSYGGEQISLFVLGDTVKDVTDKVEGHFRSYPCRYDSLRCCGSVAMFDEVGYAISA